MSLVDFKGMVSFQNLSEEEIHDVLDNLTVRLKGKEQEKQEILKDGEAKFGEIREYLIAGSLLGDQEAKIDEVVTFCHVNPETGLGYAEYYLKTQTGDGADAYYVIHPSYQLLSKDKGPELKDVAVQKIDGETYLAAKEQTERVIFIEGQP